MVKSHHVCALLRGHGAKVAVLATTLLIGCEAQNDQPNLFGSLSDPQQFLVLPAGWSPMSGGGPERLQNSCTSGVDQDESSDDQVVMIVRCESSEASFGGLWRAMEAEDLGGKRVRLSAELKAVGIEDIESIEGVGALWIRAETTSAPPIANNMRERGIRGSSSWEQREAVFDVPNDVRSLMVGCWMQGKGNLQVRNFRFHEVPADIPADFSTAVRGESNSGLRILNQ